MITSDEYDAQQQAAAAEEAARVQATQQRKAARQAAKFAKQQAQQEQQAAKEARRSKQAADKQLRKPQDFETRQATVAKSVRLTSWLYQPAYCRHNTSHIHVVRVCRYAYHGMTCALLILATRFQHCQQIPFAVPDLCAPPLQWMQSVSVSSGRQRLNNDQKHHALSHARAPPSSPV